MAVGVNSLAFICEIGKRILSKGEFYMNIYIGDRIENLDLNQEFIEFDEDVFYYILDIAEDLPTNIDVLSLINPEADTVISGEDLYSLVNILEYIIDDEMLEDYDDDVDEAIEQVELVLEFCREAEESEENIIFISSKEF